MAFFDRIVDYPGRVKLTPVSGQTNVYDMTREEGGVIDEGTLLNAYNLNDQTVNRYTPTMDLDTAAEAGTDDGDLYAAIVALGWQSEVIE